MSGPRLAGAIAGRIVEYYAMPDQQAYLAGCLAGAVLSRRMPPVRGVAVTVACGLAARSAYRGVAAWRADAARTARAVTLLADAMTMDAREAGRLPHAD